VNKTQKSYLRIYQISNIRSELMKISKMRGPRLISLIVLVALVAAMVPLVGSPISAQAAYTGVQITYNIYATDGWVQLADGSMQYMYGYIGGRDGGTLSYIDYTFNNVPRLLPGSQPPAGTGNFPLVPVTGGAPAPTGGPNTPAEQALAGHAQLPGPLIYCRVGDTVTIRFKNLGITDPGGPLSPTPNDPHTIHLHGMDVNAANDGVPETSVAAIPGSDPAGATALLAGAGNVIYYQFTPNKAGTYMYHCHQEADIHVIMGMYAALVVYEPNDTAADLGPGTGLTGTAGSNTLYGHHYDKDTVMLLTEMDLGQSQSELGMYTNTFIDPNTYNGAIYAPTGLPQIYNPVNYKPQYWLINGISFPNTIHANTANVLWTDWIQAHPGYDPLMIGSSGGGLNNNGQKILVRMINLGFETQPMHVHGFHPKVIGMDQRAWTFANPPGITSGAGMELNTILIGSGNTIDLLFDMGTQAVDGLYTAPTQSRYDIATGLPVDATLTANPPIPDPFGGNLSSPAGNAYWGGPNITPNIFPWHNHDDYKATNNGQYPGGQFTAVIMTP
jgi:FtsP/CotA-like multicopper oxidase with cupredoxin domain